jgi:hypothetical protein
MGGESRWVKQIQFSTTPPAQRQPPTRRSQESQEHQEHGEPPVYVIDLDHDEIHEATVGLGATLRLPNRTALISQLRAHFYPNMSGLDGDYPAVLQAEKRGNIQRSADGIADPRAGMYLDEKIRGVFLEWFGEVMRGMRGYYLRDGRFSVKKWVASKPEEGQAFYKVQIINSIVVDYSCQSLFNVYRPFRRRPCFRPL